VSFANRSGSGALSNLGTSRDMTSSPLLRGLNDCHHQRMGRGRTPSTIPDLFSTPSARETVSPSVTRPPSTPPPPPATLAAAATAPSLPYVLPKDLPKAIGQLQDEELDRLLTAILAEQKRRGKKPPMSDEGSCKRVEAIAPHLTVGKLNAVSASFKAGVKPSQIARQFGISQAEVRKALASGPSK
jgi:hypothetical protein